MGREVRARKLPKAEEEPGAQQAFVDVVQELKNRIHDTDKPDRGALKNAAYLLIQSENPEFQTTGRLLAEALEGFNTKREASPLSPKAWRRRSVASR